MLRRWCNVIQSFKFVVNMATLPATSFDRIVRQVSILSNQWMWSRVLCYRVPWSVWDFFCYISWCPCLPPVDIALCFVEHCSLFRELMCAAAASYEHSASWCWIMGTLCASTAVFCFVIFIVICKLLTKTRQTVTTYWWWWLRMALRFSGWMVRVKFPFSS